jgi:hypothetical protein
LPPSTAPSYAFGPIYKSAHTHWQIRKSVAWRPFKSVELKKKLRTAPLALSILHNHLLLENIMLLEKNDSIIMILSMNHLFLKDDRHSPKWKKTFVSFMGNPAFPTTSITKYSVLLCRIKHEFESKQSSLLYGNFGGK